MVGGVMSCSPSVALFDGVHWLIERVIKDPPRKHEITKVLKGFVFSWLGFDHEARFRIEAQFKVRL
jgi:hypothetical protein